MGPAAGGRDWRHHFQTERRQQTLPAEARIHSAESEIEHFCPLGEWAVVTHTAPQRTQGTNEAATSASSHRRRPSPGSPGRSGLHVWEPQGGRLLSSPSVSTLLFQKILFPQQVLCLRHLKCPLSAARALSTCKPHPQGLLTVPMKNLR